MANPVPTNEPPAPLTVTAHPPERGATGAPLILPCGCCCCCCCCCLHTVGGIVGGIVGTLKEIPARPRSMGADAPFPFRRDEFEEEGTLPAGVMYWLVVSFLVGAVTVWYFAREALRTGAPNPNDLGIGPIICVMVLPAVQLAASLVALGIVAVFYTERYTAFVRVGHITLWSFVGTLVGIGVMAAGCLVLVFATK